MSILITPINTNMRLPEPYMQHILSAW